MPRHRQKDQGHRPGIGADRVDSLLRAYAEQHGQGEPPAPAIDASPPTVFEADSSDEYRKGVSTRLHRTRRRQTSDGSEPTLPFTSLIRRLRLGESPTQPAIGYSTPLAFLVHIACLEVSRELPDVAASVRTIHDIAIVGETLVSAALASPTDIHPRALDTHPLDWLPPSGASPITGFLVNFVTTPRANTLTLDVVVAGKGIRRERRAARQMLQPSRGDASPTMPFLTLVECPASAHEYMGHLTALLRERIPQGTPLQFGRVEPITD